MSSGRTDLLNSIIKLSCTLIMMAESGLGGGFWFKAACTGKDARNITCKQRLGSTPYTCMYSEVKKSRFKIPRILMQSLCPPKLGKEGEG